MYTGNVDDGKTIRQKAREGYIPVKVPFFLPLLATLVLSIYKEMVWSSSRARVQRVNIRMGKRKPHAREKKSGSR